MHNPPAFPADLSALPPAELVPALTTFLTPILANPPADRAGRAALLCALQPLPPLLLSLATALLSVPCGSATPPSFPAALLAVFGLVHALPLCGLQDDLLAPALDRCVAFAQAAASLDAFDSALLPLRPFLDPAALDKARVAYLHAILPALPALLVASNTPAAQARLDDARCLLAAYPLLVPAFQEHLVAVAAAALAQPVADSFLNTAAALLAGAMLLDGGLCFARAVFERVSAGLEAHCSPKDAVTFLAEPHVQSNGVRADWLAATRPTLQPLAPALRGAVPLELVDALIAVFGDSLEEAYEAALTAGVLGAAPLAELVGAHAFLEKHVLGPGANATAMHDELVAALRAPPREPPLRPLLLSPAVWPEIAPTTFVCHPAVQELKHAYLRAPPPGRRVVFSNRGVVRILHTSRSGAMTRHIATPLQASLLLHVVDAPDGVALTSIRQAMNITAADAEQAATFWVSRAVLGSREAFAERILFLV